MSGLYWINDRYRLDIELGRGGLGVIYSAYDALLDRDIAVKVLTHPGLGTEGRNHLLHEARAAARLNHPNIVTVYDAGITQVSPGTLFPTGGPLPFIVMELVEGDSLHTHPPPSIDEIYSLSRQICAALEHAHAHGIVHRDLKPENILVNREGVVKLTDFGLARSITSRITTEGMIVGTLYYLPPEQALGQAIDGRTDLYALGVVLYELVAGCLPFTAEDPLAVISQHLYAPVVPPRTYNPEIPPALDTLIVKLLSKRPEDRPASAGIVGRMLEDLADATQSLPDIPNLPQPALSLLDQLALGRLVGRERELAQAKRLWKQVVEGTAEENVLLITGESGIGKTPFVREITALAKVSGGRVLAADCYPDGSAPYALIAQVVRSALAPTGATAAMDFTSVQAPSLPLPGFVLADLLTLTPDLQAHYPGIASNPRFDPQVDQQRLFESIVALCACLAANAPLILLIEDIQWSDGGTLFSIRHLARRSRISQLKILIVLTYREGELDETHILTNVLFDLNRERLSSQIKLLLFDREQTRALLRTMLQDEVTPDFLDAIYRETEGNQFFIEEMCKALIEQGKLYRENSHWRWTNMEDVQLPQSVRMAIQSRVLRLPDKVQELLRLAAIFGREFDFEPLRLASELDEDALIDALEIAERAQLVVEVKSKGLHTGLAGGVKFAFAHGLILAALRESVSGLRRPRLHRRVANSIEILHPEGDFPFDLLAYHYKQAGDLERAQKYYSRAGDQALAVYANQEAEKSYRAALDLTTTSLPRVQLLPSLGEALFRQSRYAEAIQVWEEAINLYRKTDHYDPVARLYARSARAAWYAGDPPGGLAICRAGVAAVREMASAQDLSQVESPGIAALIQETARACRFNNLMEEALLLCQQALSMARRLNLVEVQAETLATFGILPNQSQEAQQQFLSQAVELAESAGLLATAARAHLNLGIHLYEVSGTRLAREHYRQSRRLAQRAGIIVWEFDFLGDVVDASLEMADFPAAEEELAAMRQMERALPDPESGELQIRWNEARLSRLRGEVESAVQQMQACLVQMQQRGETRFLMGLNCALADALVELRRLDEAEQATRQAVTLSDLDPSLDSVAPRCWLSEVHLLKGQFDAAREILEEARSRAALRKALVNDARVLQTEARLAAAEGRWPQTSKAYESAIEITRRMDSRWYLGRLLAEYAVVLLTHGCPTHSSNPRDLLLQSLAIFEQLQIPYYAGKVETTLQALGSNATQA